jgi:hypothetical protein
MKNFKKVLVDVYGMEVWFIRCDYDSFNRAAKREFGEKVNDLPHNAMGGFAVREIKGHNVSLIWIQEWRDLAHEIFHCVHFILQDRGLLLTDESSEAYAYLTGFLDKSFRKGV